MGPDRSDLWRTLGAAARLWASPSDHEVHDDWWLACSGRRNVNYNLACCHTSDAEVLTEHCLEPLLERRVPSIIMLVGRGLATAQTLAAAGWVSVGALPLMVTDRLPAVTPPRDVVSRLTLEELPAARELLADTYGLDEATARAAVPDHAVERSDCGAWALSENGRPVSVVTTVVENGLVVIWSMATSPECQGQGYGRRLLESVLARHAEAGYGGSLLHSSVAGEKLYRALGYEGVEYLQLWSRPRWVLGKA
ncbi:MAG: GNAT family N-acetyltransferase [Acidimicrobiales bacterium]